LLLLFRHFVCGNDAYSAQPLGVEHRQEAARSGAPKTEHPGFVVVVLNIGVQWLDPDCFFGLLRRDAVPGDVLDMAAFQSNSTLYMVKTT